ncbi:MAG: type IV toxin-antitoxin system AbiEi family antitoxin domain-containing protein [Fidelibacterota bacterium]
MKKEYQYLQKFIDDRQSRGQYTFSLDELRSEFKVSDVALERAIGRYIRKNRIVSIHKGFYALVPLEYRSMGILPPEQFIDDLMTYLRKPYYMGLLTAAALHGAAHQRPQESYVVTVSNMRPLYKKGVKVNFVLKSSIPAIALVDKKTLTGYLKVSNPVLTAYDLLLYLYKVGGLSRTAEILSELVEVIKPEDWKILSEIDVKVAPLQRLGYILEITLKLTILADGLYQVIQNQIRFRVPLNPRKAKTGFPVNNRWKVIENYQIEAEI